MDERSDLNRDRGAVETAALSDEQFRSLFEHSGEAIFLADSTGTFLAVNSRCCEGLGYTRDELLEMNIKEIIPAEDLIAAPLNFSGMKVGKVGTGERRVIHKDGSEFLVEFAIWTLSDGAILGNARNITARKESESRLRLQTRLLDAVQQTVVVLDSEGIVQYWNKAAERYFGWTRAEVIGKQITSIAIIEDFEALQAAVVPHIVRGNSWTGEIVIRNKNGSTFTSLTTASPMFEGEKLAGTIMIAFDITKRKQAEEALRESEEKFRSIVDASPVAKHFYRLEPDGRLVLTDANPVADRIVGIEHRSLQGKTIEEAFPNLVDTAVPDMYRKVAAGEIGPQTFEMPYRDDRFEGFYDVCVFRTGCNAIAVDFTDITERIRTVKSLRENEERFRLIFEEGPLGMATIGADFHYLKANAEFCRFVGYTEKELTGLSFVDITHPDNVAQNVEAIEGLLRNEIPVYQVEKRYLRKDGTAVWASTTANIIHDDAGRFMYLLVMIEDITERKRVEDALRGSEKKYRLLHDSMMDGFAACDTAGRLVDSNDAFREMIGYDREEILSLTYRDLTPEKWRAIEADIVDNQVLLRGYSDIFEKEYRRKDGTTVPVELRIYLRPDEAGNPDGTWAIIRDISIRKRATEALQEERSLFLAGPVVVIKWKNSENYPVDYVSPNITAEFGYAIEDLVSGKCHFHDLVHPHDLQGMHIQSREDIRRGAEWYEQEYRLAHAGGGYRWVHDFTKIIRNDAGDITAFYGYLQDISESKQAAAALAESRRTLATLMGHLPGMAYRCANDTDRTMEYASEGCRELTGYSVDDILANREIAYAALIYLEDRQMIWDEVQKALEENRPYRLTYRITTGQGKGKWVLEEGHGVFNADGRVLCLEGLIIDITEQKRAEIALQKTASQLKQERKSLTEKNIALRELVRTIENERRDYRHQMCQNVQEILLPTMDNLKRLAGHTAGKEIAVLEAEMKEILDNDIDVFQQRFQKLSPRELELCGLISMGLSSKQIAEQLNLSLVTIHKHRERARKKLGLANKNINLTTYLYSHMNKANEKKA